MFGEGIVKQFNLEIVTQGKLQLESFISQQWIKVLALRPWQKTCALWIAINLDEELRMRIRDVSSQGLDTGGRGRRKEGRKGEGVEVIWSLAGEQMERLI